MYTVYVLVCIWMHLYENVRNTNSFWKCLRSWIQIRGSARSVYPRSSIPSHGITTWGSDVYISLVLECLESVWGVSALKLSLEARNSSTLQSSHWVISIDQQLHQFPWYHFNFVIKDSKNLTFLTSIRQFYHHCMISFAKSVLYS